MNRSLSVLAFGHLWSSGSLWKPRALTCAEPFWVLASVWSRHLTLLVILIHESIPFSLAVSFIRHHFSLEHPPINELLLWQFLHKNRLSLFVLQPIETLSSRQLLAIQSHPIELLEHRQFVYHLQAIILALLDGIVTQINRSQVHQVLQILNFSHVLYAVLR